MRTDTLSVVWPRLRFEFALNGQLGVGHTAADCAAAAARAAADGRDQRSDYRDADGYPQTPQTQLSSAQHSRETPRPVGAIIRWLDSNALRHFLILCLKRKYFNLFIGHASLGRYHFLPASLADVSTCVVS